jgi:hypothetical protein
MSTRNYPISDVWLKTQDPNAPEYCDIEEIRNDSHGEVSPPDDAVIDKATHPPSAYLTWVLSNDPNVFTKTDGSSPTRFDHIIAARFTDTGSRVSDTDGGNNIRGILKESTIITTGEFFGGIVHNEIYKRIYRKGTEVEKFWFLGVV